jgi:hypothetical protein
MSGNPADSLIYLADLRVARLIVVETLTIPGGGDGGAVDRLANPDVAGARVFKSTSGGTATLRRLVSATDSLVLTEGDSADAITFTLARAVIGGTAHATSVALGPGGGAAAASASSGYSVALGAGATANSGTYAMALGVSAAAAGVYSAAMGYGATAAGGEAIAQGHLASASADFAMAFGSSAAAEGTCSTAIGPGACARRAGTINFSGIPVARKEVDDFSGFVNGITSTMGRAAPLVALTTTTWLADATGVVATLEVPSGTVFFPETLRVWCDTGFTSSSDSLTLSVGTDDTGPGVSNIVNAMPVGLIDGVWASRVGAIAVTRGVAAGAIYFTQGATGGGSVGNCTLRCAIQGLLIEI